MLKMHHNLAAPIHGQKMEKEHEPTGHDSIRSTESSEDSVHRCETQTVSRNITAQLSQNHHQTALSDSQ